MTNSKASVNPFELESKPQITFQDEVLQLIPHFSVRYHAGMSHTFVQGLLLQASLILALGAQNLYVLDSGLKRRNHLLTATLCSICDTTLILLSVIGCAALFLQYPMLKIIFGGLGVAFLFTYGCLKFREAYRPDMAKNKITELNVSIRQTVVTTLAFSLLNPHVYLDAIILIGGYSAQFESTWDRLLFGLGASLTSWIWFFSLASLASRGNRLLHDTSAMRVISFVSGIVLISLAIKLGLDVIGWCRPTLQLQEQSGSYFKALTLVTA